jgi:hypothetical protein
MRHSLNVIIIILIENKKCLAECGKIGTFTHRKWMYIGIDNSENYLMALQKAKNIVTI